MASQSPQELLNKLDELLLTTAPLEAYSGHGPEYTEHMDQIIKVTGISGGVE